MKAGTRARIRSFEQIVETLDEEGRLDGVPFMPEMAQFCGRQVLVQSSAHKTCDTIGKTGIRAVEHCYHLEDIRCDGAAHAGCQAQCLIFWHRDWLEPADAAPSPADRSASHPDEHVQRPRIAEHPERYQCQATDLLRFSRPVRGRRDLIRLYIRDASSRNVTIARWLSTFLFELWRRWIDSGVGWRIAHGTYNRVQQWIHGAPWPLPRGTVEPGSRTPAESLDLAAGERVRIKPYEEIRKTLTWGQQNRGMWFDIEMVPFCEEEYEVERRVSRIINETDGSVTELKTPGIILKDVVCRSCYSDKNRLFCPRAIPAYWREIWLERVDGNE